MEFAAQLIRLCEVALEPKERLMAAWELETMIGRNPHSNEVLEKHAEEVL